MSEPELIYQDNSIIVVNKPAGMPVHEAKHSDDRTLVDWLLTKFPEIQDVGDVPYRAFREGGPAFGQPYRPGIVHRLDKWTSGVMVVARRQESFLKLKELFKSRAVEKMYLAVVCGRLKERSGVIEKPIGRIVSSPTKMGIVSSRGKLRLVKDAVTRYRVLEETNELSLLEVRPETGRMHQIRVHLAFIGHPVAGDTVYGGKKVCHRDLGRWGLHASVISFALDPGRRLSFSVELPPELARLISPSRLAQPFA